MYLEVCVQMKLFMSFKLWDSKWRCWFIWRIKELIFRFNFHHQKHSHISGLSLLYGLSFFSGLHFAWDRLVNHRDIFLHFQHCFHCGGRTEPWGESTAPCTSRMLIEKMPVWSAIPSFHVSDPSIYKMGKNKPTTCSSLVRKDAVVGLLRLGLPW